ncbi:glycosyltransferase [Methanoregula sp.]|uniref:glycosyltransferase n=1 Tax=Methanoregula sp. TaxID=2052170 RepID=UPI000CB0707C|nr:glycosyltransferase [Methanoregula sp.]PKG33632.1 MAG: glycosyltransferase WbuB [Methanoregula sp.]
MKILLVSTQDYIHHPVPSRHHYLFEELAQRHEVHVAHFHVSRDAPRPTRLVVEEASLFPLKNPLLHYTLNAPYHYFIFNKIIRDGKYNAVVAANVLAGSAVIRAAKNHHVPVIFDLKDWFPDSAAAYFKGRTLQEIIRKTVWVVTRDNLSRSNAITTVSPSLVEKLAGFGFSAHLITNGVDTDIFKPCDGNPARQELGIDPEDFVIGFSGSVERWYAIDAIIRALPALIEYRKKTKLLIVGGSLFTDYQQELAQLASHLGISDHVIFTGTKPYHELPRYIATMDACTIPLLPAQWGDIALPNKFFEYSACGKPIVMRPMQDVEKIGGPHISVYRTQDEFITLIKDLMDRPATFTLNFENHSWKEKSRQFEEILKTIT